MRLSVLLSCLYAVSVATARGGRLCISVLPTMEGREEASSAPIAGALGSAGMLSLALTLDLNQFKAGCDGQIVLSMGDFMYQNSFLNWKFDNRPRLEMARALNISATMMSISEIEYGINSDSTGALNLVETNSRHTRYDVPRYRVINTLVKDLNVKVAVIGAARFDKRFPRRPNLLEELIIEDHPIEAINRAADDIVTHETADVILLLTDVAPQGRIIEGLHPAIRYVVRSDGGDYGERLTDGSGFRLYMAAPRMVFADIASFTVSLGSNANRHGIGRIHTHWPEIVWSEFEEDWIYANDARERAVPEGLSSRTIAIRQIIEKYRAQLSAEPIAVGRDQLWLKSSGSEHMLLLYADALLAYKSDVSEDEAAFSLVGECSPIQRSIAGDPGLKTVTEQSVFDTFHDVYGLVALDLTGGQIKDIMQSRVCPAVAGGLGRIVNDPYCQEGAMICHQETIKDDYSCVEIDYTATYRVLMDSYTYLVNNVVEELTDSLNESFYDHLSPTVLLKYFQRYAAVHPTELPDIPPRNYYISDNKLAVITFTLTSLSYQDDLCIIHYRLISSENVAGPFRLTHNLDESLNVTGYLETDFKAEVEYTLLAQFTVDGVLDLLISTLESRNYGRESLPFGGIKIVTQVNPPLSTSTMLLVPND